MSEGCYGCTQKAIEINRQQQSIIELAQYLANENNEWYGIYTDEYGIKRTISASTAAGIPIEQYISPKL